LMQKYFVENPVGQKRAAAFFKYVILSLDLISWLTR
jgi:hypothetical protein